MASQNKVKSKDNEDDLDHRFKDLEDQINQDLRDENRHRAKTTYYDYNNNEVEQFSKDVVSSQGLKRPESFNSELNDFRME
jgi:hypothetical protein